MLLVKYFDMVKISNKGEYGQGEPSTYQKASCSYGNFKQVQLIFPIRYGYISSWILISIASY